MTASFFSLRSAQAAERHCAIPGLFNGHIKMSRRTSTKTLSLLPGIHGDTQCTNGLPRNLISRNTKWHNHHKKHMHFVNEIIEAILRRVKSISQVCENELIIRLICSFPPSAAVLETVLTESITVLKANPYDICLIHPSQLYASLSWSRLNENVIREACRDCCRHPRTA